MSNGFRILKYRQVLHGLRKSKNAYRDDYISRSRWIDEAYTILIRYWWISLLQVTSRSLYTTTKTIIIIWYFLDLYTIICRSRYGYLPIQVWNTEINFIFQTYLVKLPYNRLPFNEIFYITIFLCFPCDFVILYESFTVPKNNPLLLKIVKPIMNSKGRWISIYFEG